MVDQGGVVNYIYIVTLNAAPLYVDPNSPAGHIPLYVGVTSDFISRMRAHEISKPWWNQLYPDVDYFETHSDRKRAERFESHIIRSLAPVFNVADSPAGSDGWASFANRGCFTPTLCQIIARRRVTIHLCQSTYAEEAS